MSNPVKKQVPGTCLSVLSTERGTRAISGQNQIVFVNSGRNNDCCLIKGLDFQYSVEDILLGLSEVERDKPTTSVLFRRTKHILCCVLGIVPGYRVLMQLWNAVLQLRNEAHYDTHIGAAHIIVRLPGREETALGTMRFDIVDDAVHGN